MSSNFETLPDEILMLIFQYSGDVHSIFRTFLGLNHRLNQILIDKRLHLLTDYLCIDPYHIFFNSYYNSTAFNRISQQFAAVNSPVNDSDFREYFQSLISFHVEQQYKRCEDDIHFYTTTFKSIQNSIPNDEQITNSYELRQIFHNLIHYPVNLMDMKRIESLVLERGAYLECDGSAQSDFNFCKAINQLLLSELSYPNSTNKNLLSVEIQMFKALIISNPRLLTNEDFYIYSLCSISFFLILSVFQARYYCYDQLALPVNMNCYHAIVDLLLFVIQYERIHSSVSASVQENLFDMLYFIPSRELVNRRGVMIETIQLEIFKIIVDIYISAQVPSWSDDLNDRFQSILKKLMKKERDDVILYIYRRIPHVRYFFNQPKYCRAIVNMMTGSQEERLMFRRFLDETPGETWLTSKQLVFILLQKKERKLLEKVLRVSRFLMDELDEDGNHLLLHICLKVRGCRHQLVELLIQMKSDLRRKNFNGEDFCDAIKLPKNRKLLEKLDIDCIMSQLYM
ncbi:unnamed protein product [Adineta ricciae]|uniref:Uncharacterized protein n=1 Tax=Adineta ricciae TaxID=249248 RepID=A0A813TYR0_ADIRI|nr:unnamed protein product [Adineta ricciae]